MDKTKINAWLDEIERNTAFIREEINQPDSIVIGVDDDLQAALDRSGLVEIAHGVMKNGSYNLRALSTALRGQGDNIINGGLAGPALDVNLFMSDVAVSNLEIRSQRETVMLIGRSDASQSAIEAAPVGVSVTNVLIGGHRGKCGFEVDGRNVMLNDCRVMDLYDPERQDSKAIWVGNSPGEIYVYGGYFEAASENMMVGGAEMKIPGVRPTKIHVIGSEFAKPFAWKGLIPVKNLLELKDGNDVLIKDCRFHGCWVSAQGGYGLMFTPSNGGSVRGVVVDNCTMWDVGGCVNITGTDASGINPDRTQVEIVSGSYRTNKITCGGNGWFALITRGPEYFKVSDAIIRHEGSALVEVGDKAPIDQLHVINSNWNYGTYGIRIGGLNHGDNSLGQVRDLKVEGCTILGAHSAFKSRFPNNTYTTV